MQQILIVSTTIWILITSIPLIIVVFSLCLKKKTPTLDVKNGVQGQKKPLTPVGDSRTNNNLDKKPTRITLTDKAAVSQPEKVTSPLRPGSLTPPMPQNGANKTGDEVGDDNSKKGKGFSEENRNALTPTGKGAQKPFGVTGGGPVPVGPTEDKKEPAMTPKPLPGNASPDKVVEPTQKSFQSSKKKKMASKERDDKKAKPKSEKAPPQFAPEMEVDDDEETLQNVKSLEKDLEPSLQNDAK